VFFTEPEGHPTEFSGTVPCDPIISNEPH